MADSDGAGMVGVRAMADRLGVTEEAVRKWAARRLVPALRLPDKRFRFDPAKVEAALQVRADAPASLADLPGAEELAGSLYLGRLHLKPGRVEAVVREVAGVELPPVSGPSFPLDPALVAQIARVVSLVSRLARDRPAEVKAAVLAALPLMALPPAPESEE